MADTTSPNPPPSAPSQASTAPPPTTATIPDTIPESALTTQGDLALAEKSGTRRLIKKKRRPARPQVDPSTWKGGAPPPQTGTIFNIWYNKWSGGDREDKYISKSPATSRCNISTDSGYTRADKVPGSFFCLFFARGLCPRGHECEYLHRLPTIHDMFNPNVDCFGRDKHSDYRDDMGGVGSFMRQNHTLYIGRIHVSDDIEEVVARHFAEWGQIERIRVLNSRGVGFVTYSNEANAQFAKEAMAHQSLDHNEILNVRWATVDPNPMAQARDKRRIEEQAAAAIRAALPQEFVREIEGKDHAAVKRRRIEGSFGLRGYEAPEEVWYARGQSGAGGAGAEVAYLTEGYGDDENDYRGQQQQQQQQEEEDNGGILSNSTIAALKGYAETNNGPAKIISKAQASSTLGGPLVAYGSDDDSD
ncbi:putative cell cycle control protein [Peziza echinospora]|nr:putative cell cycle control protein [Peziza echinospora]